MGTHIFPEVLLNDISGPDGDSLLLSLKLAVDVLVSNPATVFLNSAFQKNGLNLFLVTWDKFA